jgi:hypothetical protein
LPCPDLLPLRRFSSVRPWEIPDQRDVDWPSLTQLKRPWKDCIRLTEYCYAALQRSATYLRSGSIDFEI